MHVICFLIKGGVMLKQNKTLQNKVKNLLLKGKRTGCVSFDEVKKVFPKNNWDEEKINNIVRLLEEAGIDLILDEEETEETNVYIEQMTKKEKVKEQTPEEETKEARHNAVQTYFF